MKKEKLPIYLSAVMLILLALCFYRIGRLEGQLSAVQNNIQNSLNSQYSALSMQVDNLAGQLANAQLESESQLSESGWEFGGYDADTGMVAVLVHLNLKECDPTTTQVTVNCNDSPRLMRWDGTQFVAQLDLPLMETSQVTTVLMEDNGVLRTQNLDWTICPVEQMMLHADGWFECTGMVEQKDGKLLDQRHGTVVISAYAENDDRAVESIDLVWMADDAELSRQAVDMSYAAQAQAAESINYPINVDAGAYENGKGGQYFASITDDRTVSQDATLSLYAVVTDDLGLQYWVLCDMTYVGDKIGTATAISGSAVRIVDANGNEWATE